MQTFALMTSHIFIYGEIGSQVTAKSVQDQIDPQATEYEVHISSVGGDVYEGYAIYGILQNLNKPTTVRIEGLCASIATLIAQAGDKVIMSDPAEFMIHNPNVTLSGEATDLVDAAEQLERIKKTIISVYRKRTGLSEDELSRMMDVETWMTAHEAKQRGFVDEVQEKLKAVAYIDTSKIKMNSLEKILKDGIAELKNMLNPKNVAQVTLADGRVVTVNTESGMPTPEEMVGATVVLEDGSPLEDGAFQTAEGVQISVAGGIITEAIMVPPMEPEDQKAEEDPNKELEEMKAKIAELEQALAAKDHAAAEAEAKVEAQNKTIKKFEASIKTLEAKYNEIKNITVGDPNPPVDAHDKKMEEAAGYDPAAEDLKRFMQGRGF